MRMPKRTVKRRLCHHHPPGRPPPAAPRCWATCTEKPMAAAAKNPLNSQVVLAVRPTAAVAWEPRDPTMAVSTYCTRVIMICSTMAGQAKNSTAPQGGLYRRGALVGEQLRNAVAHTS